MLNENLAKANDHLAIDTLALESTKEYQIKMGRWRKRALTIATNSTFWAVMATMHRARQPLIHFSAFVKKAHRSQSQEFSDTKIVQIVSFKCKQIMAELFERLATPLPAECVDTDRESRTLIMWLSFKTVCRHACQFHRRVFASTQQYPYKLFLLIASKPGICCQRRKSVAAELVELQTQLRATQHAADGPSSSSSRIDKRHHVVAVHPVVKKIIADSGFYTELVDASTTGVLKSKSVGGLYNFLGYIATYLKVDVAQNERVNKLLTMLGQNCPNASLVSWSSWSSQSQSLNPG